MTLSPGYKHQRPITDVQLAEVIAKRTRDGVARGERHRRAHEAEAAAEAAPLPLLTPAQRAAMILNAYQVAPDGRIEVRYLDEIAGRRLDYTGRVALRD